jgi:hypothetical protein
VMTDQNGPGQADKKAAEQRTAQVAAENKAADQQERKTESAPKTAAEKVAQSVEASDVGAVDEAVAVNPYPAYEEMSLDELRSAAESRGVEINRDVEKAQLIAELRRAGVASPEHDLMPLERLREAASGEDVKLPEEFEKAHLITELRAADTHTS